MCSYHNIPSLPGYYLLILRVHRKTIIFTRGKRRFSLDPGVYIYIGSAHGPGGLRSRIMRHLRRKKKIFWHIDYLTMNENVDIIGFVTISDILKKNIDLEKLLSRLMQKYLEFIPGFGCSDKKEDRSHLFYCGESPSKCLSIISTVLSSIQNNGIEYTINILTPTNI